MGIVQKVYPGNMETVPSGGGGGGHSVKTRAATTDKWPQAKKFVELALVYVYRDSDRLQVRCCLSLYASVVANLVEHH